MNFDCFKKKCNTHLSTKFVSMRGTHTSDHVCKKLSHSDSVSHKCNKCPVTWTGYTNKDGFTFIGHMEIK